MAAANGGLEAVSKWSEFYFVPGMSHCGGGQALDDFDLLGAIVNWVEKGAAPTYVSDCDWESFSWPQSAALCLSEARTI
jgi:hypothetical protein